MRTLHRTTFPLGSLAIPRDWAYVDTGSTRDPRLDLMRGLVFLLLFVVHFDYFSIFTIFAWERFGVVSSAETFIALAGVVTGMVFGRKMNAEGFRACLPALFRRALDLYKLNVLVILSIGLMRYLPVLDLTVLTTFRNPYTGITYPLYPPLEAGLLRLLIDTLLLRCGPHQFQIIGLYVGLFLLTPLILFLIERWWTVLLSAISCALYLLNFMTPEAEPGTAQIRLTGAMFEYAFPLIAWQFLYVHAVIVGYHKTAIANWLSAPRHHIWVWACAAASLGFMVFSLNHPLDMFPSWTQFSFMAPDTFNRIYGGYFQKYNLGPGRLLNQIVLLVTVYAVLTRLWVPVNETIGWLFVPLGAASLYVFTIHIVMLGLVANSPLPGLESIWVNSAVHVGVLLLAWYCVKRDFLGRWLPH
jgi:hypothetical protein